jgi:predicted DNA-binding protein
MNVLKAFRLEKSLATRLTRIAKSSKRSEKYYVEEALRLYFEEYEDARIAKERFEDPKTELISSKELRKRVGL